MNKLSTSLSILLVIIVAILFNSISSNLYTKVDITENKQYTLSEGTKKVLDKLKTDLTLKLYMSNLTGANKASLNDLEAHKKNVMEFLEQYSEYSKRVKLDVVLVEPDSEEEDTAIRYGLYGSPIGGGVKFYIGLVAINNSTSDKETFIPLISPDPIYMSSFEYEISKIIIEATSEKKPKIGVISHYPVLGTKIPPEMQAYNKNMKEEKPWAFIQALQYIYEFVSLSKEISSTELDMMKLDGIVLIHPKDLSPKTLFAIDQFLLKGGKLIAFTDELSVFDNPTQESPDPNAYKRTSEIDTLTESWGLKRSNDSILCDKIIATEVSIQNKAGAYETLMHPTVLTAAKDNFKTNSRITAGIQNIWMPHSGVYSKTAKPGLTVDEIVFTSRQNSELPFSMIIALELPKIQAACNKQIADKGERDPKGLVYQITGKFTTAFPDGKPKEPETDPKTPAPVADNSIALKESQGNPIAILVTDVDMLNDQIMFRQNPYGQTTNSNFPFVQNLIEMTMGNEDLISIRTKSVNNRPFTVLDDIKKKAEENTQKEIKAFQDKETAASAKLNDLQIKTENGQLKITLTPEQMEEQKKLREQMTETRKQIRKLQFQQRKDVESKVFSCKMFNYLLFPTLLSLIGLGVMFYQNRRVKKNG